METTEKRRFVKTIEEEELIRLTKNNPLEFFEKYPFRKIREACVKAIKDRESLYYYYSREKVPEWLEECIPALLEQNDRFAEELLEWYICEGTEKEAAIRAIEFALKLKNKIPIWYNLSKFIAGRLLKDWEIELYPQIPSLRDYLLELLKYLAEQKGKEDGYSNFHWIPAERAMRIISAAGDFSFLPQIEELILLYQNGSLKPYQDPPFAKSSNISMLKETRRFLYRAQRESLAKKKE